VGKVTIIIESNQMQTPALYAAVQKFMFTEESFKQALLDTYGFSPGEVGIFIVPSDEED